MVVPQSNGRDRYQTDLRGEAVTVPPGESRTVKEYVFAGAKEVPLLERYAENPGIVGIDRAVDWGWFRFLTKPFFHALLWFKSVLGSFGLAMMIFLSVLVFFVSKSNNVKRSIVTANALEFNKAYVGATFHTNIGDIKIEFLHQNAPQAIYNFIELAEKKFYNGTKFHYVLKGFLIQAGDPLSRSMNKTLYGTGGPGHTLPNEKSSEPMKQGIVAMASMGKNTSGSQFFILTAPFGGRFGFLLTEASLLCYFSFYVRDYRNWWKAI